MSATARTLLYIGVFDPHVPLSGTGQRARHLLEGLSRRFVLDVAYIDGNGRPPVPEIAARFADGLPRVRRKVAVPFDRLGYFLYHPGLHRAVRTLAASASYDAVLCDYGLAAAYGLSLRMRFDLPLVYLSHNVEHRGYLKKARTDPRRLVLFPWVYAVERLGVQRSDLLVAITEPEAEFFSRWKPRERIVVVQQGFDPAEFHPFYEMPKRERKVVMFCGNFGIQFNRDAARAFVDIVVESVLERHPDTEFRFVGAHPPTDIRHPALRFTGFVDDYAAELRAADVFVSPILAGVGSPTKVIEALASGKNVVATPEGARSVSPDYRHLHVAPLPEFPEIVSDLLDQRPPPERADYDRLRAEHSWSALVDRLGNAVDECIDRRAGRR